MIHTHRTTQAHSIDKMLELETVDNITNLSSESDKFKKRSHDRGKESNCNHTQIMDKQITSIYLNTHHKIWEDTKRDILETIETIKCELSDDDESSEN
jgi:hypothetical protein